MDISVIGLGKLGSVIAALYAANGHKVIGVDLNQETIDQINQGKSPFLEPKLQSLIDKANNNLKATNNLSLAIINSELTFIIVPTPSNEYGVFSNEYLFTVLTQIAESLKEKNRFHTIVINSTVMPESCDKEFVPLLEQVSGKKINNDFGLVYSPEFIALGNIVSDMINPDLVLIGESNTKAGQIVEKASKSVIKSNPEIHHMALVNAEVVKIAINTFVTTKISFANMLSEICDKLPNADVSVVTNAVGSDSRIGKKYLKAALGYGGPCFPRDNIALTRLAENLGVSSEIPKATDEINKKQVTRVVSLIESFSNLRNVGILGLSYKPDTPVVDESQGIMIANLLVDLNKSVSVHDPFALTEASPKLDSRINIEPNLEQILNRSEILVISTPWKNYAALDSESLLGKIIIDSWRILDADKYNNVKIIHPGKFYARN